MYDGRGGRITPEILTEDLAFSSGTKCRSCGGDLRVGQGIWMYHSQFRGQNIQCHDCWESGPTEGDEEEDV